MNKQALINWIATGEVGTSSKTMWAALTGAVTGGNKGNNFDVPHDPADFRRCLNFIDYCSVTTDDLQKVKEVFHWWAPQIDNWPRLVELWEEESPAGMAPKLYDFLQELENQSMVLAGWERRGENGWIKAGQPTRISIKLD